MKIIKYAELLLKYKILKHDLKIAEKSNNRYEYENEVLRISLLNEEQRTKLFLDSYRKTLNELEDSNSKKKQMEKQIVILEKELKKLRKENKKNNYGNTKEN